tara:strand:- start:36 stop:446 length:411 start_codon:yes stop_codon:yes gene_type:complete
MWYPAEIVLKSYLPTELEVGMLFINRISVGVIEPYVELFELEELPEDSDAFMAKHGCPVELAIVDDEEDLLASHDEIGWWDDGEDSDEYRDITLDDINYILRECEGYVDIQIEDGEDFFVMFIEDKVVLSLVPEEE